MATLASPENRQTVYDINKRADYGYISYDEYARLIAEAVHISPEEAREIFQKKHIRNEPLIQYVRSLRSRYKTALLSNVGHDAITQIFTAEELENVFDSVVLSAEVGMVKPSPEVYTLTASRLDLRPDECVMIDDIPRNIEGAQLAGMKGVVYSSNQQIKAELERVLGSEQSDA
jgi:HAD superfamily hydrolase (TIGR01509 family)